MIPAAGSPTYSVIQRTLDQPITLQQLEEASMHVPTIARADCIRIHRLLAGIFISRLSHPEALAFQRGLAAQDHEADVIEDSQLPALPLGTRAMRVSRIDRGLHFSDFMDRVTLIPLDEVLFIAAACIEDKALARLIHLDHPLQHRVPTAVYEEEIRWRFHRLRQPAGSSGS